MIKIILGIFFLTVSLFAIDKNSVINKLNCQTYSFNEDMAGIYKYFDPDNKLWFLYMPKLNYLLIHETGKPTFAEGAQTIPTEGFTSLTANAKATFGSYIGSNERANGISDNEFSINDDMAGIYKYFDPDNKLWFLYMPKLNYLLIHETGKTSIAEGAIQIDVANAFQEITVIKDPFGNVTGSIKFVAKGGCSTSSSSSSEPASSSSSSEPASSSSSSEPASSSSSSEAASSSSSSVSSSSSSTGLETPPEVPSLGSSSSGLSTPPSVPNI